MLKAIGILLIIFGVIGLIQNLRFLVTFRKITKSSSDETFGNTAVSGHFLGLLVFSLGIFFLGVYLVQR